MSELSEKVARSGDILNKEDPLVKMGTRSVFANSAGGENGRVASGGGSSRSGPDPAGRA